MLTSHQYKIKKELKRNPVLSDQLYDLTDLPEFLLRKRQGSRKTNCESHQDCKAKMEN